MSKLSENYIHLTNNCLQQNGVNYGIHEDGNTLSFTVFKDFLRTEHSSSINFETHILSRMKDLMIDTYMATKNEINSMKRKYCFELIGYDFLIDEDFRVWLIEVGLI